MSNGHTNNIEPTSLADAFTPPAASTADQETRRIVLNLQLACVASCGCDVKTPEVKFHFAHCRYRQIMEALDLIESLTAQLARAEAEKASLAAECRAAKERMWECGKAADEAERKLREAEGEKR